MALQSRTITVGADKDVNNGGKNYVSGQVIYIKNEAGVLAPIFRDIDGLDPIAQNTISNVTNAKGQFTFFIEEGNYIAEYNDQSTPLFVFGADYFNNQIDFVTNQILSNTQPYSAGNFTDGFTFTGLNQYGNATVNDGGTDYATTFWYIGGTLPHTVAPLTNPRDFPLLYQQRDFNSAEFVATKTTESAQDFIDSFALKVFQSPTDGLTEINTRTLLGGEVCEVRKVSDGSFADIYTDKEGLNPIAQNGTSNVSGSDGVFDFFIADGDYSISFGVITNTFSTLKLSTVASNVSFSGTDFTTYTVGRKFKLTDYNNALYEIVDSADSGGYYLPIDASKKLKLVNDSVIDSGSVGESDLYQLATIYNSVNNAASLSLSGEITVSQNVTIDFPTTINFGAVIKPVNGVTVSIGVKPTVLSNGFKVFNTSLGGEFSLTITPAIDEVHASWFGMTPYDTSEVVAKSNMKAIADALKMAGSLGVGLQAIGRAPTCLLPVGVYTLDLPDGATEGAVIESYVHLLGYGDSSYYSIREGAPSFDVFVVNTPAANSVIVDKFQLDGNQGAQVNTHNGLVFNTPTGAVIYSEVGDSLYIKEMSGHGIKIIGAGVNNSVIKPKLVRDCKLGNLFVSACDQLDVEGSYRSSKGSSPSMHFNGSGVQVARLNRVTSEENGGYNLLVENTNTETGYVSAHGGSYSRGGSSGVRFDNVTDGGVFDADVSRNAVNGVQLNNTVNVAVKSNRIKANKQRGVFGVSADDGEMKLNEFDKNSDTNVNVYDDITLITSSNNDMQLNKFRNSLSTTRYNIAIDDAGCVSNLVTNNDLLGSGNTGTISDAGTGTVTTSGNRV